MFISELQYTINGQRLSQASVELTNNMGWGGLEIIHVPCEGQNTLQSLQSSSTNNSESINIVKGARGSVVVKALCCKLEGRGFKSR
jgi:hypothetical protein